MARGPVLARGRRARGQRGFTLIELLVTVVVTVVGLIGLFGVFTVTSRGNSEARETAEAMALLENAVDTLKTMPMADIQVAYQPYTAPELSSFMPYHEDRANGDVVAGTTGVAYVREVAGKRIDGELFELVIQIEWSVDGAVLASATHRRQLKLHVLRSASEVMQ